MLQSGLIDAVIVATPHYDHPRLSMLAMRNGIHTLCEKPAGVYTAQVQEMNDCAGSAMWCSASCTTSARTRSIRK
jgi:predicted dehydrogenase